MDVIAQQRGCCEADFFLNSFYFLFWDWPLSILSWQTAELLLLWENGRKSDALPFDLQLDRGRVIRKDHARGY